MTKKQDKTQDQGTSTVIGEVKKNDKATVKIRINEFKGKTYIDIRTFVNGGDYPTTKGVSLPIDKLSDLINLIEEAEAKTKENK